MAYSDQTEYPRGILRQSSSGAAYTPFPTGSTVRIAGILFAFDPGGNTGTLTVTLLSADSSQTYCTLFFDLSKGPATFYLPARFASENGLRWQPSGGSPSTPSVKATFFYYDD